MSSSFNLDPSEEFPEKVAVNPLAPKCINYEILEMLDWPEEVFIHGGMLSRGDTMLVGAESKGGKSTLLGGMIRQMITGGDFLGFKVERPLRVMYMQAELREYRLKERLLPTFSKLSSEHKKNLYIWSTQGLVLFNDSQLADIEREIFIVKPDVLIIDPMLNFHNYNENDSQQMAQFFRYLDKIKNEFDMAIIMAHHFRKAPQDAKMKVNLLDCIRGSSALRGWAVTTIAMEGRGKSEYRELAFDLRNSDEPIKRTIRYNPKIKDFDWHDPMTTVKQWTIEYLEEFKGTPTTEQYISAMLKSHPMLSNNRNRAFSMRDSLVDTGVIHIIEEGKKKLISRL